MPQVTKVDVYEVEENGHCTYVIASTARGALEAFIRNQPAPKVTFWDRLEYYAVRCFQWL